MQPHTVRPGGDNKRLSSMERYDRCRLATGCMRSDDRELGVGGVHIGILTLKTGACNAADFIECSAPHRNNRTTHMLAYCAGTVSCVSCEQTGARARWHSHLPCPRWAGRVAHAGHHVGPPLDRASAAENEGSRDSEHACMSSGPSPEGGSGACAT